MSNLAKLFSRERSATPTIVETPAAPSAPSASTESQMDAAFLKVFEDTVTLNQAGHIGDVVSGR